MDQVFALSFHRVRTVYVYERTNNERLSKGKNVFPGPLIAFISQLL